MHQRCKDMKYYSFLQALSQLYLIATRYMKRYSRGMPPFLYLFFLGVWVRCSVVSKDIFQHIIR